MSLQRKLILVMVVGMLGLALSGCMPLRRPVTPTPPNTPDTTAPNPQLPNQPAPSTPGTTPTGGTADRIITLLNAMPEVQNSYALTIGNVAFVGVDLKDNVSADAENKLKDKISNDVKREQPELAEVWVTGDPDLVTRIRDLSERITRGEPITGFFTEIEAIAKKLQPQSGR